MCSWIVHRDEIDQTGPALSAASAAKLAQASLKEAQRKVGIPPCGGVRLVGVRPISREGIPAAIYIPPQLCFAATFVNAGG